MVFDSHYYGRTVLAPFNIILYNLFSPHGPNLYGREPFTFYIYNLLLNWNMAYPMALLALPTTALAFKYTTYGYCRALHCGNGINKI